MRIKEDDGSDFRLPGFNPLMAKQITVWNLGEGVYINWQLFGKRTTIEDRTRLFHEVLPDLVEEVKEEEVQLRNEDGTAYDADVQSAPRLYDRDTPDHSLMDSVDREQICRSGGPIEYYRVMVDGRMDPVWMEQRQKITLGAAIPMTAVYEPVTPSIQMGGLGFPIPDSGEQMTFYVSKMDFLEKVGEMPRVQSMIKTCDDGMLWEIADIQVNLSDSERKIWGKHHLALLCTKYRESITDNNPDPGPHGQRGTRDPINLPRVR